MAGEAAGKRLSPCASPAHYSFGVDLVRLSQRRHRRHEFQNALRGNLLPRSIVRRLNGELRQIRKQKRELLRLPAVKTAARGGADQPSILVATVVTVESISAALAGVEFIWTAPSVAMGHLQCGVQNLHAVGD